MVLLCSLKFISNWYYVWYGTGESDKYCKIDVPYSVLHFVYDSFGKHVQDMMLDILHSDQKRSLR